MNGLKAYFAASIFTADNSSTGTLAWYGTSPAKGSSITPGVSYAIGPFYVEAAFKYSNYDKSLAVDKADPTFDPSLKVAYTFSF